MYVIKTLWYKMSVYYVSATYDDNGEIKFRDFTEHLSKATIYENIESVEEECRKLNDPSLMIYPICPVCNRDYEGHPALSRYDNKTLICSNCGIKEAIEIFIQNKED